MVPPETEAKRAILLARRSFLLPSFPVVPPSHLLDQLVVPGPHSKETTQCPFLEHESLYRLMYSKNAGSRVDAENDGCLVHESVCTKPFSAFGHFNADSTTLSGESAITAVKQRL